MQVTGDAANYKEVHELASIDFIVGFNFFISWFC